MKVRRTMREEVDVSTLPPAFPLTSREAQVLRHIALGLEQQRDRPLLAISVETVKEHVQNILRKIRANDRTDAARAVKSGIVIKHVAFLTRSVRYADRKRHVHD